MPMGPAREASEEGTANHKIATSFIANRHFYAGELVCVRVHEYAFVCVQPFLFVRVCLRVYAHTACWLTLGCL